MFLRVCSKRLRGWDSALRLRFRRPTRFLYYGCLRRLQVQSAKKMLLRSRGGGKKPYESVKKKVVPCPRLLLTHIEPPCFSTILFTFARPIPVPGTSSLLTKRSNGRNILSA